MLGCRHELAKFYKCGRTAKDIGVDGGVGGDVNDIKQRGEALRSPTLQNYHSYI